MSYNIGDVVRISENIEHDKYDDIFLEDLIVLEYQVVEGERFFQLETIDGAEVEYLISEIDLKYKAQ